MKRTSIELASETERWYESLSGSAFLWRRRTAWAVIRECVRLTLLKSNWWLFQDLCFCSQPNNVKLLILLQDIYSALFYSSTISDWPSPWLSRVLSTRLIESANISYLINFTKNLCCDIVQTLCCPSCQRIFAHLRWVKNILYNAPILKGILRPKKKILS